MRVFNLQCDAQHHFEGWFSSEEDYAGQMERGLLACPICGDRQILRLPSAPRLNLGADAPDAPPATQEATVEARPELKALQAAYLQFARKVVDQTEDVGERFSEEARRMHYGESEERGIRGQASPEQTRALIDEGIPVLPLMLPPGLKGPLQ